MAPTLPASRGSLPPEGALRLWPGKAGSTAPACAGGEGEVGPTLADKGAASSEPELLLLPLGEGGDEGVPEPACREFAPTLPTLCGSLPPGVAAAPAARQSRFRGPCWWGQDAPTFGAPRPSLSSRRSLGFTLIELLVALAALAVMAGMSWRGLDGMVRAQAQIHQRTDAVLTLQAGLTQWAADLDALLQLPQTQTLDWDGRGLRMVRRSTAAPGQGLLVVAWARRNVNGVNQWLRWQSPPQFTRGELQTAWNKAAQWSQNPGEDEKRYEVRITALDEWQIFYFRGNAWTNPLSSGGAAPPVSGVENRSPAPDLTLPDGVRLVLTLPPGQAISGVLTRDWVRPVLGGGK